LSLFEIVVCELGDGREDTDYILGTSINMLDLVLVNFLHLLGHDPGDLVLANELII
jgi:hypothetical protein